jgi:cytochrome P450
MDISEDGPAYMAKRLIDAQLNDEKRGITSLDIATTTGSNVGAGSDTTSLSLASYLFYLYQHPRCLEHVRRELEGLGPQTRYTFQEVQKLPYLQATIKEALRMYPGTGYPMWRIVPQGGLMICGQLLPEGVSCLQMSATMKLANNLDRVMWV